MSKTPYRLGDKPIEARYHDHMNRIAAGLDELFNDKKHGQDREVGFVLLVFPFGASGGRCNYISNGADRNDVIALMKEQIAYFEGQAPTSGKA